jgi:hypothetical protein
MGDGVAAGTGPAFRLSLAGQLHVGQRRWGVAATGTSDAAQSSQNPSGHDACLMLGA